ncbi:MAG: hypothetical protein CVU69_05095 [Deltaproteobacteria bacterium HGW-Deltaproteobacteria-4]|nr:MAG: hypothetical protein CVU69_05095 [Deltaproteobacteria bacterium HGW-Deltaproteobacteria-4]
MNTSELIRDLVNHLAQWGDTEVVVLVGDEIYDGLCVWHHDETREATMIGVKGPNKFWDSPDFDKMGLEDRAIRKDIEMIEDDGLLPTYLSDEAIERGVLAYRKVGADTAFLVDWIEGVSQPSRHAALISRLIK